MWNRGINCMATWDLWSVWNRGINPIALREAKIVCNFDLSEWNRVKSRPHFGRALLSKEAKRNQLTLLHFLVQ